MASASATDTQPSIKAIPEVRIVSIRATVENYRAQSALWTKVTAFCKQHDIAIAGACFTLYYDRGFKPKDVDLEVCLPILPDAAVPTEEAVWGDIQVRTLPAVAKAAAITHVGSYDGLPAAYNTFYSWIDAHHYEPTDIVREVYLTMNASDVTERSFVTELLQPIA